MRWLCLCVRKGRPTEVSGITQQKSAEESGMNLNFIIAFLPVTDRKTTTLQSHSTCEQRWWCCLARSSWYCTLEYIIYFVPHLANGTVAMVHFHTTHTSLKPKINRNKRIENPKRTACLCNGWETKKKKAVRKWILNRIRTIIYMKTKSLLSILSFLYCFGMPFSVNDGKPFSAVEGSLLSCSRTMIDTVNMYSYVSVCVCVCCYCCCHKGEIERFTET